MFEKVLRGLLIAFLMAGSLAPAGSVQAARSTAAAAGGWYWQNPLPQGDALQGVAVLDAATTVAVGGYTVIKTTDSTCASHVRC
jgi:hypothetical protein